MREPDILAVCAFCPAPCRAALGEAHAATPETAQPSALALVARSALAGRLPPSDEVVRRLADLGVVRRCQAACSYGLDVAAALDAARAVLEASADAR